MIKFLNFSCHPEEAKPTKDLRSFTSFRMTSCGVLSIILIVALIFTPVFSYAEEAVEDIPPDTTAQDSGIAPARLEAQEVGDGKISMDFSDATLPEVLKVLSSLSGINFVTSEDAALKKINIFLENVTFEDALSAIIKGNGLIAQKVGEQNIYMIRVGTGEDALVPLETKIIKLKYLRAAKPKEISISEGGASSGGSSGSTGGSTSITSSTSLKGGEPGEVKDLVEDLLSPRGKVIINDSTNSLIVTDTQERLEQIEKVITALDHKPDQVLIEVIMLETAFDFDRYLGTDWGTGAGSSNSLGTVAGAAGNFNVPGINQFGDLFNGGDLFSPGTGLSFGSFDFSQMSATLRALQTDDRTKILAKPKILVLNNEPAFVKITVNAIVAQNSSTFASGGSANISTETTERTEIGVSLQVTPIINDNNTVTMTIEPRFSTLETAQFDSSFLDPRIRASRTTLSVPDGQVITIGGLLSRDETKGKRKIPILGDIPLFGIFFTKWTTLKLDRELIIFIRPQIVHSDLPPSSIRPKSIADGMTTAEEESTEFWKVWKKDWFKDLTKEKTSDTEKEESDAAQFFEGREKAMDQSLSFHEIPASQLKEDQKSFQGKSTTPGNPNPAPAAPSDVQSAQNPVKPPVPVKPA